MQDRSRNHSAAAAHTHGEGGGEGLGWLCSQDLIPALRKILITVNLGNQYAVLGTTLVVMWYQYEPQPSYSIGMQYHNTKGLAYLIQTCGLVFPTDPVCLLGVFPGVYNCVIFCESSKN